MLCLSSRNIVKIRFMHLTTKRFRNSSTFVPKHLKHHSQTIKWIPQTILVSTASPTNILSVLVHSSSHYLTIGWFLRWSHTTFVWTDFDQNIGENVNHIILCCTWRSKIVSTPTNPVIQSVISNTAAGLSSKWLLMICRVLVETLMVLLLEHEPSLTLRHQFTLSRGVCLKVCFSNDGMRMCRFQASQVSLTTPLYKLFPISAYLLFGILQRNSRLQLLSYLMWLVTCYTLHPIPFDPLADPHFGRFGRIDIPLGVDVFVKVLCQGWQTGSPNSIRIWNGFWLGSCWWHRFLCYKLPCCPSPCLHCHCRWSTMKFLEIEVSPKDYFCLSSEEWSIVQQFEDNNSHTPDVLSFLCLRNHQPSCLETISQAVRRFFSLKRCLHSKEQFDELDTVMDEYFKN